MNVFSLGLSGGEAEQLKDRPTLPSTSHAASKPKAEFTRQDYSSDFPLDDSFLEIVDKSPIRGKQALTPLSDNQYV